MSRVQNGVLSNQPGGGYDTLSDITSILRPELQADNVPGTKTAVQRSSSSPSIGDIPAVGAAAKQTGVGVLSFIVEKCLRGRCLLSQRNV